MTLEDTHDPTVPPGTGLAPSATGPVPDPAPRPLPGDEAAEAEPAGALEVLRRGLGASPELRRGLGATVLLGLAVAAGRLTVPVIIQQALDREPLADGSPDTAFVLAAAGMALVVILGAAVLGWVTQRRLVDRAEEGIANLRTRAFDHIHRLSVADHNDTKRGVPGGPGHQRRRIVGPVRPVGAVLLDGEPGADRRHRRGDGAVPRGS